MHLAMFVRDHLQPWWRIGLNDFNLFILYLLNQFCSPTADVDVTVIAGTVFLVEMDRYFKSMYKNTASRRRRGCKCEWHWHKEREKGGKRGETIMKLHFSFMSSYLKWKFSGSPFLKMLSPSLVLSTHYCGVSTLHQRSTVSQTVWAAL